MRPCLFHIFAFCHLQEEGPDGFFADAGAGGELLNGDEGGAFFAQLLADGNQEFGSGAPAQTGDVGYILGVDDYTIGDSIHKTRFWCF